MLKKKNKITALNHIALKIQRLNKQCVTKLKLSVDKTNASISCQSFVNF